MVLGHLDLLGRLWHLWRSPCQYLSQRKIFTHRSSWKKNSLWNLPFSCCAIILGQERKLVWETHLIVSCPFVPLNLSFRESERVPQLATAMLKFYFGNMSSSVFVVIAFWQIFSFSFWLLRLSHLWRGCSRGFLSNKQLLLRVCINF